MRNMLPIALATLSESCPSASVSASSAVDFMIGAAAISSAGRKLSLWKENSASMPPKTTLRSGAGTTVSLLEPPRTLTGAAPGLMYMSTSSCRPLTYVRSVLCSHLQSAHSSGDNHLK